MGKHKIQKVWTDENFLFAVTEDGLTAKYAFSMFPRLSQATPEQRNAFVLSHSGIHWPEIDEDINFEEMFHDSGLCPLTETEDSVFYEF